MRAVDQVAPPQGKGAGRTYDKNFFWFPYRIAAEYPGAPAAGRPGHRGFTPRFTLPGLKPGSRLVKKHKAILAFS